MGTYERRGTRFEVSEHAGSLRLRVTQQVLSAPDRTATHDHVLEPVAPDLFVYRSPHSSWWVPVRFFSLPGGPDFLHTDLRSTPRTS